MGLDQATEMVRAAGGGGRGVCHQSSFALFGQSSHHAGLIEAGKIGQILSVRIFHAVHLPENLQGWRITDKSAGGGVVLDIVVHDADVTRFLTGEDPMSVAAMTSASGMGQGVEVLPWF